MISDEQLSPIGESSVPIPNRMLRRLKKATSISELCPESETLDSEKADGEDLEKPGSQSPKDFNEEEGMRSDIEGLCIENGVTAKKLLDFDNLPEFNLTVEDLGEKGEDEISDLGTREEIRVSETTEVGKEPLDSVPEPESALEEFGEKGDDEISDLGTRDEIRVSKMMEAGKERKDSVPESESAHEELDEKSNDEMCDLESEEEIRDLESEEEIRDSESKEAGKKRSVLESSDSEEEDKKRNKKSNDFDELPISTASMNMTKKERREYLDQLRAENQRLLRETGDAAFQPVPLVRKPISSVLEKIRRRKEEISKQFLSRKKSKSIHTCDVLSENEKDFEEVLAKEKKNEDMDSKTTSKQNLEGKQCLKKSAGLNLDSPSTKKDESSPTHQDSSLRSQPTNFGDKHLEKTPSRSLEEVMTPSILAMNLKLNLSPMPDKSYEEEEFNKENSNPEIHDSPGDPVRKFIDEDAEEEDDSDNDLLRFEDEDDDDEEDDDLEDMIVSQFKEDPTDEDRRNELHQKWLEQQDAAGTEKLLQKLKRGLQQDETLLSEDEHENADDEEKAEDADEKEVGNSDEADEDEDEDEKDPSYANTMRKTIKNIKERIPLMFTDEDDVYVSSDDEEMKKKLLQQLLYEKMELKAKSSSSTGHENPEEILRHIKKPESKKKTKPSSFKERALMDKNKNPAASKSSFLGRLTKSSISEGTRKRGSNVVRGYIFERNDSNSKSSKTMPEEPSDPETIIQDKSRQRSAPAKFTASQSQERSQTLQATMVEERNTRQRATLYEILKMSSHKTCFNSRETVITSNHTDYICCFQIGQETSQVKPTRKEIKKSVKIENLLYTVAMTMHVW